MCTVVCRWQPENQFAVQLLALRDEFADRAFDLPGRWWPDSPDVVGGRDRSAGGSWCASDVATATSAVVLNQPRPRAAKPGAPSRGVLPLLAVRFGDRWPEHLDVTGMAGFHLVLVSPGLAASWSFDGSVLDRQILPSGTHMFTPRGITRAGTRDRFAAAALGVDAPAGEITDAPPGAVWGEWLGMVQTPAIVDDGLVVCRTIGGRPYETVFGQFVAARPGLLRVDYIDHPAHDLARPWTTQLWRSPG